MLIKKQNGYSLVELLAIIPIIAIFLVAIYFCYSVYSISSVADEFKIEQKKAQQVLLDAWQSQYYTDNGCLQPKHYEKINTQLLSNNKIFLSKISNLICVLQSKDEQNTIEHKNYFKWSKITKNDTSFLVTKSFKNKDKKEAFINELNVGIDDKIETINDFEDICTYFNVFSEVYKLNEPKRDFDGYKIYNRNKHLKTTEKEINTDIPFGCYKNNEDVFIYINI